MKFNQLSLLALMLSNGTLARRLQEPEPECLENGYEVFQQRPNTDVDLELSASVDTTSGTYELTLSFKPDESLPFLNDATADNFVGMNATEFNAICAAEGLYETVVPPILSPENHVGLNEFYTDYNYGFELSDRAAESIGFKLATLGASPCGTFLQPFPQYNIHFYTITKEERKEFKCDSGGGYFCKPYVEQCSDAGRKMNMSGAGLPRCPDAPPGPPVFQNIPAGYAWTIDNNPINGLSAATPAMGLHAIDPAEFAPTRSRKEPYTLMLNYDSEVIANHVVLWSGIANGEAPDVVPFTKETPSYNCQTEDKAFFPTTTMVDYHEETGRTSIKIAGPLADSSGESYTEVMDSRKSPKSKSSKAPKDGKRSAKTAKSSKSPKAS